MSEILVALVGGLGLVVTALVGVVVTVRQSTKPAAQASVAHANQATRIEHAIVGLKADMAVLKADLDAHVAWEEDPRMGKYREMEVTMTALFQALKEHPSAPDETPSL